MNVFAHIREWFLFAYQVFVDLALDCWNWPIVGNWLGNAFADLADFASEVSYQFWRAAKWWDSVEDALEDVLSWHEIRDWLSGWFDLVDELWEWVRSAKYHVTNIIEEWWETVELNLPELISDIKSWVTSQLNTFQDMVLSLISDVENWTTTQINNVTDTLLDLITDVKTWTTTQLNNVREAILLTISDVRSWTLTEVNNIKATISAFLPWDEIVANIVSWGALTGTQITALLASWFKDYEPFWAGWQDVRDSVFEFFADPLEWLWARFTGWFLGPEG